MRKLIVLLVTLVLAVPALADESVVRIATYNIQFLNATSLANQGSRRARLQEVISLLDADVIGLQEINDTAALRAIFPATDWVVLIDEDSDDSQDVALAVRKREGLSIRGLSGDNIDADNQNFLFPNQADNNHFPNRRDVLFAEIELPGTTETVHVFVVHPKARPDGRALTDPRREGAAIDLANALEHDFHEANIIVIGDYNDNPDDRSVNILESGNPNAHGGEESGDFLINLAEELVAGDHVSHGRTRDDINNGRITTIDPGSRRRNNQLRGSNSHSGDILFDQILISPRLADNYRAGSIEVFDAAVAIDGSSSTRASDHLPVYAEFAFGTDESPQATTGVRIVRLLPDPVGPDTDRETVTLRNTSAASIDLTGWVLRDRSENEFRLSGSIAASTDREIRLTFVLPLTNSGDEVRLVSPAGDIAHSVTYTAADVTPGVAITFP